MLGSVVNISSYNSVNNQYTFPCDGYLCLIAEYGVNNGVIVQFTQDTANTFLFSCAPNASIAGEAVLPVKKGMTCYVTQNNNGDVRFFPLA